MFLDTDFNMVIDSWYDSTSPVVVELAEVNHDLVARKRRGDKIVDAINICPAISKIMVLTNDELEDIGVKIFFSDGTFETAICGAEDKFELWYGLAICMMKRTFDFGDSNSAIFNKLVRYAEKFLDKQTKQTAKEITEKEEEKKRSEKRAAESAKRKAERRQNDIDFLADAITKALQNVTGNQKSESEIS